MKHFQTLYPAAKPSYMPQVSCNTRTLNRMTHVLQLPCGIYEGLAAGSDEALSDIVSTSYTKTICRIHKWVVQQMVRAGIYVVPSREDFLKTMNWDLNNPEQKKQL